MHLSAKEIYRRYLKSPGWAWTKRIRKDGKCARCPATTKLELHHQSYSWHNRHEWLRWIFPNLFDPMVTLCDYHHEMEHKMENDNDDLAPARGCLNGLVIVLATILAVSVLVILFWRG